MLFADTIINRLTLNEANRHKIRRLYNNRPNLITLDNKTDCKDTTNVLTYKHLALKIELSGFTSKTHWNGWHFTFTKLDRTVVCFEFLDIILQCQHQSFGVFGSKNDS